MTIAVKNQRRGTGTLRGLVEQTRCSFCGKGNAEVRTLIAGQRGFICDECVITGERLLYGDRNVRRPGWPAYTPAEIVAALDETVIGQDRAKRILAVALYNHHKRLASRRRYSVDIAKSNILLIGPPGTGKTLLAKGLARIADVPFVTVDATTLTETGYLGADVESALHRLLEAAGGDVSEAESGIVYIDEIDKIAKRASAHSGGRDIAGEGVQQALLRMLEAAVVSVPFVGNRRFGRGAPVELDTTDILFIGGGSFAGLDDIVLARERAEGAGRAGFLRDPEPPQDIRSRVHPEDLVAFGLIPELVGRIPVLASLDDLDEADLLAILLRPRDALVPQYEQLFRMSGVELRFEEAALRILAQKAAEQRMGARGLRAILERLLLDLMFALPDRPDIRQVVIDRSMAETSETEALLGPVPDVSYRSRPMGRPGIPRVRLTRPRHGFPPARSGSSDCERY